MSPQPKDPVRKSWHNTNSGAEDGAGYDERIQLSESDYLRDLATALVGERYLVGELIGRGGMAAVFEAVDVRLNRPVALKVLPPEFARRADIRERFVREAQTAARLNHKNIVQVFSVDESERVVCFAMTLVRGESLAARLRREPRMEASFIARVLEQVADALAYAHASGVVHRDIKPDNVLLETAFDSHGVGAATNKVERVVVTDFGIAHAVDSGPRLTKTGVAVGTPAFMSPEQAMGEKEIDGRSDIYSLGVLGYLMLTGRLPFDAGSTPALLLKHVNEPLVPVGVVNRNASPALGAIVERCLAKAPKDRWESALALRDALRRAQREDLLMTAEPRAHQDASSSVLRFPVADAAVVDRAIVDRAVVDTRDAEIAERNRALRRHLRGAFICALFALVMLAWTGWQARSFVFLIAAVAALGFQFNLLLSVWDASKLWMQGVPPWRLLRGRQAAKVTERKGGQSGITQIRELSEKLSAGLKPGSRYEELLERAAADRVAIGEIAGRLGSADLELVPDVLPTAEKLLESIGSVAVSLDRLESDLSGDSLAQLRSRLNAIQRTGLDSGEPDNQRLLLERQVRSLEQLTARRDVLRDQLDRAVTALHTLRLDMVRLETMGVGALAQDRTSLTEQVRSVSRDVDIAIDSASESGRNRG